MIQGNKYYKEKKINKNYFCIFNFEEYFKLTIYVARRESIKKNNKLSKVDWGITMSSTKNDISLKKRILKKNQPFHIFFLKILNLKKDTYWIMCLAEILDLHKTPKFGKTKSVEVFDLLLEKGLVIGLLFNYLSIKK